MTKGGFADEFKKRRSNRSRSGILSGNVATRLGVFVQSLDKRGKASGPNATARHEAELKKVLRKNLQLKAELRRAQEERGILKKTAAYFAKNLA